MRRFRRSTFSNGFIHMNIVAETGVEKQLFTDVTEAYNSTRENNTLSQMANTAHSTEVKLKCDHGNWVGHD